MLETAIAQLRFVAAIALGRPVPLWALDRLIAAARDTRREFGTLGSDAGDLLGGPAHALVLLAEEHHLAGKKRRASVLSTYPSYLGALVEQGLLLGYRPADFGLERIAVGGEVVTEGLKVRCRQLFGTVQFLQSYAMTETWPFNGTRCEQGHLHFEASQGLLEVLDLETGAPARPGEAGTIVATPFPPYREATVVLRYDTQDVVRALAGPLTCSLRNQPATGDLLGKLRHSVRHEHGWTFPRDVLVPYLYLALPPWLAAGLFAMAMLSLLYYLCEPVLRGRWALWLTVLVLLGADVTTAHRDSATSPVFYAVNNGVLALAVVGLSNLWAQSGLSARDVSLLAGLLVLYDLVATSLLPVTDDLIGRLGSMPFEPLVAWGAGHDRLGIGLGDLLLATMCPLVLRKAFGRPAGIAPLAIALGTIGGLLALVALRGVPVTLPVMTVLGPLMAVQYVLLEAPAGSGTDDVALPAGRACAEGCPRTAPHTGRFPSWCYHRGRARMAHGDRNHG